MIRTRAYIGQHISLYCSAMGKVFLAYSYAGQVADYWSIHSEEIAKMDNAYHYRPRSQRSKRLRKF